MASRAWSSAGSTSRGARDVAGLHLAEDLADVLALERRLAGQQTVEGGAQRVDVGARAQPVEIASGLLGAHVGRRAQRAAGQGLRRSARRRRDGLLADRRVGPAHGLGQPPVDHQRLAVPAQDDVGRLEIPMDHAAGVGVIDGVADVEEAAEQLAQLQRAAAGVVLERVVAVEMLDGLLEGVALDEPHGVIGAPAAVGAQAIDRHDARVLQPAGDLGLGDEPLAADGIVGVLLEDLLQRHLAVQLGIQGHEHLAQPAARVRPQHAEPLAIAGGRADRQTGSTVGVVVIVGLGGVAVLGPCDVGERRLDLGLAQRRQAGAGGVVGGDGGQALLDVAALRFNMQGRQGLDGGALRRDRDAPARSGGRPGDRDLSQVQAWNAATSCALLYEAGLQGQQSEEEMAVGGGSHDMAPILSIGQRPRPPGPAQGSDRIRADYRRSAIPLHPCRGVSSDGVSGDPRPRDWKPTRRGVKMSGGAATHFNYNRDTLAPIGTLQCRELLSVMLTRLAIYTKLRCHPSSAAPTVSPKSTDFVPFTRNSCGVDTPPSRRTVSQHLPSATGPRATNRPWLSVTTVSPRWDKPAASSRSGAVEQERGSPLVACQLHRSGGRDRPPPAGPRP